MKAQAQVVDLNQYRGGGRPCGGKLYSLFHSDSSNKGTSSTHPGVAPDGHEWRLCSERGWILKKIKNVEEKQTDNVEDNIDNLFSKKNTKKEKGEQNPEIKKEDELSRIVKNDYTMMQREIMEEINQYRRVQNYEELNKNNRNIISINQTAGVCPLCGSKLNQGDHEEKIYSKAA